VESFIKKEIYISYYTLDYKDEILKIKSKYLYSKYLGYKFLAYIRFSMIESDYLLSSTPNIGNPTYPLKKPKMVKNLVHIFHSISDISIYRKGSLDYYDSVILGGKFQEKSIRELEQLRGLKKKKLLPLGVPYLDFLIKKKTILNNDNKTILIGSSWGNKGCLRIYGIDFIKELSKMKFNIIVRPHPHSFKYEKRFITKCKNELEKIQNIRWDDSACPSESMNMSDLLISDTSSLRFDFIFIHEKPVITLDIKANEMTGYERQYLSKNWTDTSNYEIGPVINKKSINTIEKEINSLLKNFKKSKIKNFRANTIYNFGMGSDSITEYFLNTE
tara:strand:- start:7881 stop:8873 length:993 start_codon:yes stop_codon:yes gene_type:complete